MLAGKKGLIVGLRKRKLYCMGGGVQASMLHEQSLPSPSSMTKPSATATSGRIIAILRKIAYIINNQLIISGYNAEILTAAKA